MEETKSETPQEAPPLSEEEYHKLWNMKRGIKSRKYYAQPKELTLKVINSLYRLYCRLNMTNKKAARYIRQKMLERGYLGYYTECQIISCKEEAAAVHEISYKFDDLMKQDNYLFLCLKHHAIIHKSLRISKRQQKQDQGLRKNPLAIAKYELRASKPKDFEKTHNHKLNEFLPYS